MEKEIARSKVSNYKVAEVKTREVEKGENVGQKFLEVTYNPSIQNMFNSDEEHNKLFFAKNASFLNKLWKAYNAEGADKADESFELLKRQPAITVKVEFDYLFELQRTKADGSKTWTKPRNTLNVFLLIDPITGMPAGNLDAVEEARRIVSTIGRLYEAEAGPVVTGEGAPTPTSAPAAKPKDDNDDF